LAHPMTGTLKTWWLYAPVVAELFATGDREFQTAGTVILNALDWKLILVAG